MQCASDSRRCFRSCARLCVHYFSASTIHEEAGRYVYAPDPDAVAAEFAHHGAAFSVPLKDTHDGLRGFEICDPDGYVLFFGRPR
jgi:hypothetical protein